MIKTVAIYFALAILVMQPQPQAGDSFGNPAAGLAIAKAECSGCHAIGKTDSSPLPAAPPLRTFSEKWPVEDLQEALGEGMSVGHGSMPEFIFEPNEISDLVAYLVTIQSVPN